MQKSIKILTMALSALSILGIASCSNGETAASNASEENELVVGGWNYLSYVDADGEKMNYGLYIPEGYTADSKLPLISYIGDSTWASKTPKNYLKSECIKNWCTSEKMKENPAMFLTYNVGGSVGSVNQGSGKRVQEIIDLVTKNYGVDENRLYLTGQSMGGIYDWAVNDAYPDKFAATVYVGCQPGGEVDNEQYTTIINNMKYLNQKFVYIASAKDPKAPYGQADVKEKLDANEKEYTWLGGLDYKDIPGTNTLVKAELAKGKDKNFFQFTTVTENGTTDQEHMKSFEYCYEIDSIYEWLVSQHK